MQETLLWGKPATLHRQYYLSGARRSGWFNSPLCSVTAHHSQEPARGLRLTPLCTSPQGQYLRVHL